MTVWLGGGSDFRGLQALASAVAHVLDEVVVQQQFRGVVLDLDGLCGLEKLLIRRKERDRGVEAFHLSEHEGNGGTLRNGHGHHRQVCRGAAHAVQVQQRHIEKGDFDRRRRCGEGGSV